jgi:putative spermidine/putrescine transport system permease protein
VNATATAPLDAAGLVRGLRRAERRIKFKAATLTLPLFAFVLLTFIVPIAALLSKSVVDADVAKILPHTVAALRGWDGQALPTDAAFDALIGDIRAAREAGTLASAGTRLNYDAAVLHRTPFAGNAGKKRARYADRE